MLDPENVPQPLRGIPATLLITVWGRALATEHSEIDLEDQFAVELYRNQPELFSGLDKLSSWQRRMSAVGIGIRSVCFDRQVSEFLRRSPDGMVLNLGCGLDARSQRLDNGTASWVEVDVEQALLFRRRLLQDDERHQTIVGSIAEPEQWLQQITRRENQPLLILAEGLLPYFPEDIVRALFVAVVNRFSQFEGYVELLGDFAKGKVHPLVKAVGSQDAFRLGARDPAAQVPRFHSALSVIAQENLFQHQKSLWGLMGWVVRLLPNMQQRLGSVMVHFEANAPKE